MDYHMCRICLTGYRETALLKIFGTEGLEDLVQKLQTCLPFQISVFDGLPKYICYKCLAIVDQWYNLVKIAVKSNAILHKNFGASRFSRTKAVQYKSNDLPDDDVKFSQQQPRQLQRSVTIQQRQQSTWVLNQNSSSDSSSGEEDASIAAVDSQPAASDNESDTHSEPQPEASTKQCRLKMSPASVNSPRHKKPSPTIAPSPRKIQKTNEVVLPRQTIPTYVSAFHPVPYKYHPYIHNHGISYTASNYIHNGNMVNGYLGPNANYHGPYLTNSNPPFSHHLYQPTEAMQTNHEVPINDGFPISTWNSQATGTTSSAPTNNLEALKTENADVTVTHRTVEGVPLTIKPAVSVQNMTYQHKDSQVLSQCSETVKSSQESATRAFTPNNKPSNANNHTPFFEDSLGLNLNFCKECNITLSPHDNMFKHLLDHNPKEE